VTKTWFSGEQLLLFIHGGAGTGKTTLAKAIIQAATIFNLEHRFSATSGVAGLLNNGTTIHHLLAQQGELTGAKPNVNKIRLRNGNARVILIDEVSCRVLINVSDDICGCIFQQR
jgi:adenylate kinase family enzyme